MNAIKMEVLKSHIVHADLDASHRFHGHFILCDVTNKWSDSGNLNFGVAPGLARSVASRLYDTRLVHTGALMR